MVAVMKLEKAPKETYADIGGLTTQIQEIKVRIILDKIFNTFLFI
jgi:26S proteasome regulatory subunit T2